MISEIRAISVQGFERVYKTDLMTFSDYQTAAARTMNPRLNDHERLLDAAAGVAEEAGEVLAHVRKHLYQEKTLDRERLAEELGDVLWCVAATATAAGLSLEEVAARNTEKLARRWPDGMPANR